jgi:hypothetical protein
VTNAMDFHRRLQAKARRVQRISVHNSVDSEEGQMSSGWKPIETAPWQKVVLVRNDQMEKPIRATRGYVTETGVHPDSTFFTSVYTPDKYFPDPAGRLVCPTVWKELEE